MKTDSTSFSSVAAFFMLLCSLSIFSPTAAACPVDIQPNDGSWSFIASSGGSQIKMVTITSYFEESVYINTGSDLFAVDQTSINVPADGSSTFTITFKPGANATGTLQGLLTVTISGKCSKTFTFSLSGTVPQSGLTNSIPNEVSLTVTPNPATNYVNIMTSGARTAEIGIYDLLGKEIASSKSISWKWDASNISTGSYIVRISGLSNSGYEFISSKRIVIAR